MRTALHEGEEAAVEKTRAFVAAFVEREILPPPNPAHEDICRILKSLFLKGEATLEKWVDLLIRNHRPSAQKLADLALLLSDADRPGEARDVLGGLVSANLDKPGVLPLYLSAELKASGPRGVIRILNREALDKAVSPMLAQDLLAHPDAPSHLGDASTPLLVRLHAAGEGTRPAQDALSALLAKRAEAFDPAALALLAIETEESIQSLAQRFPDADSPRNASLWAAAGRLLAGVQQVSAFASRGALQRAWTNNAHPESRRLLATAFRFHGVWPLEALFTPQPDETPSPLPPKAETGLLIVSTPALSEKFLSELRSSQPKTFYLSMKPGVGDLWLNDILVAHNSAGDHAASHEAEAFGAHMADALFPDVDPDLRGIWALSMADRLFPHFKRAHSFSELLRRDSYDQALILLNKDDWRQMLAVGGVLQRNGVKVWASWSPALKPAARRRLLNALPWRSAHDPLQAILAPSSAEEEAREARDVGDWAQEALDRIAAAREPEAGPLGPFFNRPLLKRLEADFAREDRFLMVAGVSDPSYFAATEALTARMEERGEKLTILDVGAADKLPKASEGGVLPGAAFEASRESFTALSAALRERMAAFCARLDPSDVPPGALMAFANLSRAAQVALRDCGAELVAARGLIEEGRPRKLITLPGRAPEIRGATILARRGETPSVDLQAFYISAHPRYKPSLADVYCAITTDQAKLYREEIGPPEGQIVQIMGSLSMERRLASARSLSKADARRLLDMPPDARILLFGAQHGSGEEGRRILDLLIAMVPSWPAHWRLAVKLHPRESQNAQDKLAAKIAASSGAARISLHRTQSIYEMIVAADVTATQFSNVGLEAAALGRPVLAINLTQEEYAVDLAKIGVAERISSPEALRERAEFWMAAAADQERLSPQTRAYLDENPYIGSSGAADAVIDLLKAEIDVQETIAPKRPAPRIGFGFARGSRPAAAPTPAAEPFSKAAPSADDENHDALLAQAADLKRRRDVANGVDLLLRAYDLEPSPRLAGRIGAEALILQDLDLARRMFGLQGLVAGGVHKLSSHIDLLRCALLDGEKDEVERLTLSMPKNWWRLHPKSNLLFATAIAVERLDWIADLLVFYLRRAETLEASPHLQKTLFALKSPDQAETLALALSPFEEIPLVRIALIWLRRKSGRQREAIDLLRRLSLTHPSLLENDALAADTWLLPALASELKDGFSIKERLKAAQGFKNAHCCAVVCSGVDLNAVQNHLFEAGSIDILPLPDFLASPPQTQALSEAVAKLGRASTIKVVDPLMDYGEQNTPLAMRLSELSDRIGEDLRSGVAKICDAELGRFFEAHHEALALHISSSFFGVLRRRAALRAYLQEHRPKNVVLYVNAARSLHELTQIFSSVEPKPQIFIVNAFAPQHAKLWAQALERFSGRSPAPSQEEKKHCFIRVSEPDWSRAKAEGEAWAEDVAKRFEAAEKRPLLIASVQDRSYGPTVKALKNRLQKDFSLFSLIVGYGGMKLDAWRAEALQSEVALEYPTAPSEPIEFHVTDALAASWFTGWGQADVKAAMRDCGMSRELLTEAIIGWSPVFLRYGVARNTILAHGLKHLFERSPPAAFLVEPTRAYPNRILAQAARDCGIKVVEAMAVYMSRMPRYRRPAADLMLAIDTFSETLLTDHFGMAPEQVRIIGSLRFEEVRQKLAETTVNPFVKPGEKTIMVVTQNTTLNSNLAIVWQSLNLLRKAPIPELRLVIKMHPVEPEHHSIAYAQEVHRFQLQSRVRISRSDDPYLLARASSLVVSKFSNLILEAAALDVPGLVLAEKGLPLPVPFDEMGVAIIAEPGAPFLKAARQLIEDGASSARLKLKREAFFKRNPLLKQFGSAEAAHEAILQLVEGKTQAAPPISNASRRASRLGWLARFFQGSGLALQLGSRLDRMIKGRR